MKGRWKWVFLVLGVLLISATCGFGYEQKQKRSQFEEAEDALRNSDWDRLALTMSQSNSRHTPSQNSIASFLRTYVDPIVTAKKPAFETRQWASSMVPIPNEEAALTLKRSDGRKYKFLQVSYTDDVLWIPLPVHGRQLGIFQGKRVSVSFFMAFFRVAYELYPPARKEERFRSAVKFVRQEKERLKGMGISPQNIYSPCKTWEEFLAKSEQDAQVIAKDARRKS